MVYSNVQSVESYVDYIFVCTCILVGPLTGNLPFATTAEELETWVLEGISQPDNKDVKAEIAMDGIGRARGFGYIDAPDDVKEAILKLHGE